MAAPAFRAKSGFGEATATQRKLTVPATTVAGDTLFVALQVAQKGVAIVAPAGWKEVAGQKDQAVEECRHALFYLPNWDGVTTEYTFTWGGASKGNRGVIWSMSGAHLETPVHAISNEVLKENTPKSKNAVCDAVTTTAKECRMVTIVFNNEGATVAPAAGWSEQSDQVDGPELCTKTASSEAGVQAAVTHTVGLSSLAITLQFAVQPPKAGGEAKTKEVSDSVTATDTTAKAVGHVLADSATTSDSRGAAETKPIADAATASDAASKGVTHALSDQATASDALSKSIGKATADAVIAAESHGSSVGKALIDAATASDARVSAVGKALHDAVTATDSIEEAKVVITAAELKAAKPLDPLTREPPAPLFGEDWHGTFADPGEGTPTGWTHIAGEEFSTARWWRYGFPAPAYLGLTFGDLLSEGQEIRMVLADNKVGNAVVLKIVWNNPEVYFYALYEQIGGFEVEPALAQGFVPRVKDDRFYLSFEEGPGGIRAWRQTGGGDPEVFAEGTLTQPLEVYGHAADLYLQHPGTFRGLDFTAVSLNPEPPIEEKPTPKMRVVLNGGGWGGKEPADIAAAVHMVRYDTELGVEVLEALKGAGLLIHCLFAGPYDEGGVSALDPDEWVANALAFYEANLDPTVAPIVEILNEPHGPWFWGPEANTVKQALAYRTLVKKAYEGFHGVYGDDSPKIIASVEPVDSWGERWWEPNVANYLDGVVVHPYGGTDPEEKAISAEGRRREVKEARVLTGNSLPVYCSEFGWPTAIGKESTGDSLQWTEAEQAANITAFFNWARATGYVAEVVYFCHHDFGTKTWYGVVRLDGSHKPGYAAVRAATFPPVRTRVAGEWKPTTRRVKVAGDFVEA